MAIVGLCVAVGLVIDGMRAREHATKVARRYCGDAGLQFLDGTVSLRRWRIRRAGGSLTVERRFQFDYSDHGPARHYGVIVLVGRYVSEFVLCGRRQDRIESHNPTA